MLSTGVKRNSFVHVKYGFLAQWGVSILIDEWVSWYGNEGLRHAQGHKGLYLRLDCRNLMLRIFSLIAPRRPWCKVTFGDRCIVSCLKRSPTWQTGLGKGREFQTGWCWLFSLLDNDRLSAGYFLTDAVCVIPAVAVWQWVALWSALSFYLWQWVKRSITPSHLNMLIAPHISTVLSIITKCNLCRKVLTFLLVFVLLNCSFWGCLYWE